MAGMRLLRSALRTHRIELSAVAAVAAASASTASSLQHVVAACDTDASPWQSFKPSFRGQVTPLRSLPSAGQGPALELQKGPFHSRWIRLREQATAAEAMKHLQDAERGKSSWVGIPDELLEGPALVAKLRQQGYKFHHTVSGLRADLVKGSPANELFYYKWVGDGNDMVPCYTTSHEGVGALILSPEKDAVLLVWEYDNWKMITGNLDGCDTVFDTVRREIMEECSIDLDEDSFCMVGGWQHAESYDNSANNVFNIFIAVARSRKLQVDGKEITLARWFPLKDLPTASDVETAPRVESRPYSLRWNTGDAERDLMSRVVPKFLETYWQGRGLRVQFTAETKRTIFG